MKPSKTEPDKREGDSFFKLEHFQFEVEQALVGSEPRAFSVQDQGSQRRKKSLNFLSVSRVLVTFLNCTDNFS